jgi:PAS domain S-box-containing protein
MYGYCEDSPRRGKSSRYLLPVALVLLLAASAHGPASATPANADTILTIGVRAHSGVEAAMAKWGPTADALSEAVTGHSFVLAPTVDFEEMRTAVAEGTVDFVLTNPSAYAELQARCGASRIATLRNLRIEGGFTEHAGVIFASAARTDITDFDDIPGRSMMGVHVESFGGWQMALRELKDTGIDPREDCSEVLFAPDGTQEAVVRAVVSGQVDIGTVSTGIIEGFIERGELDTSIVRILNPHEDAFPFPHSTRHYPEWAFAKARHTPDELARQVAIVLLAMMPDDPAAIAGGYTGWTIPLDYTEVHTLLRELRLGPYEDYGRVTPGMFWQKYWSVFLAALLVVIALCFLEQLVAQRTAALRKSEALLAATGRMAQVGGWEVDARTREVRWTDETYRIHEVPLDHKPSLDEAIDFYHPDDRQRLASAIEGALEHGEPYDMEIRLITAKGKHLRIHTICKPHIVDGKTVRLTGAFQDITAHRQAEAERDRLMLAIEQVAESVVITDAQGTIQYVNPIFESITGYRREEAIGQNPRILGSGEHDDAFYREMWDTLTRPETWHGRIINKKKDGTLYTEEATISPVRDASGRTVNYVAAIRDITKELALEAQLLQAQKMEAVGQLAGGVAHDFNNILQAILGHTQFAREGLPADDPRCEDLEEIRKGAERAATLTRQLLAFSRRQIMQAKDLDINNLIDGLLKMVRRIIGEDIQLEFASGHRLGTVHADPGQMEQVLMNLCVNARDALPGGGTLTIETENGLINGEYCETHAWAREGPYNLISVTDTGQGMNEGIARRAFEPFFTTKEVGKGTGLGLATVYGIVKQHDGMINVYSEVGKGTTFKIYLPIVARRATEIGSKIEGRVRGGTETILLAEDDEGVRGLIERVLQEGGYSVLIARDGQEALDLFEVHAGEISLALLDVIMPRMGGREAGDRIREANPDVRIVYTSGYSANGVHTRFALDEGVDLIQKPCDPQTLLRRIREVLDRPR